MFHSTYPSPIYPNHVLVQATVGVGIVIIWEQSPPPAFLLCKLQDLAMNVHVMSGDGHLFRQCFPFLCAQRLIRESFGHMLTLYCTSKPWHHHHHPPLSLRWLWSCFSYRGLWTVFFSDFCRVWTRGGGVTGLFIPHWWLGKHMALQSKDGCLIWPKIIMCTDLFLHSICVHDEVLLLHLLFSLSCPLQVCNVQGGDQH